MKIAFFTNHINEIGGVERVICNLSNYFCDVYNYDVDVISFFPCERETPAFKFNDKVKLIYCNYKDENCNKITLHTKRIKKVRELFENKDYDYIISTNPFFNIYILKNDKYINSKVIACEHGKYDSIKNFWRKLTKYFYKRAYKTVFLSNEEVKLFKENSNLKNVISIPNGIEIDNDFKEDIKREKEIISVGRYCEEKAFHKLIDIFYKLSKRNSHWTLKIVGDGELKADISKMVKDYGLEDRVKLVPFDTNIKKYYKRASIFAMSSISEGFPMVLLEAMAEGLPCIAFNIKDCFEDMIKNNENGFLIEPFNEEKYVESLEKIINDENKLKEFSLNAKKNVEKYSLGNIAGIWKNLFEDKIGGV
ncbi:glycosyltransferase family 4 protein [Clostridium fallax]|uniref:Glycosyltransferase involved in cell wall bisynthesis n=1 Tax=Clostridium fallax TaxID=1533 RepID=A0A1M4SYI8_9CLOT|nr:glycosyltransferase family 4 protein [Clostridium fallax]SHE37255.1 Glycosyltransferase involved in cell wall bisynthesis [Clostridium fallax]SQB08033.1 glycosyltransferase [Clostridium fallax]